MFMYIQGLLMDVANLEPLVTAICNAITLRLLCDL